MPTRKLLPTLVLLATTASFIAGCTQPAEELATTLRLRLGGDPPTIDPCLATDARSLDVLTNLFVGLTGIDHSGGLSPKLATTWDVSDDGLTWTFHLRDDAYWVHYDPQTKEVEKKRPVTAHDVEYGAKRTIDPSAGSSYAYVQYIIKNAYPVNTGEEGFDLDSIGVLALDDRTVQFTLEQPAGYFPHIAGMWVNYPLPREVVEEFGDKWVEPGKLWSNGPFLLDVWEHDYRIVLVKNPHYYDAQNVLIETVNMAMVQDASTAFKMYEAGELDTVGVPFEDMDRVRADPTLSKELHLVPQLSTFYLAFNMGKAPVDNALVRRALAMALDKQALVENVLRGSDMVAKVFAAPGVFGSPAEDPTFEGLPFDPQQARASLADAGYPEGSGFPEIIASYPTSEGGSKGMEFVQQQWKEHLGIEVKLSHMEWKAYLQSLADPSEVFMLGWSADYPDENNWVLEVFHPTKGSNAPKWDSEDASAKRFMEVTQAAAAEPEPSKREDLYFEAEKILCQDEGVIIPLFHRTSAIVSKPYLERTFNPLFNDIHNWRVKAH